VQVFNKKQIPWLLLFLVQLGFLVFGLETKHIYTADSAEYLHQAENIFHEGSTYCGDPTIEPREPPLYSRRPPGYGTFILLSSFFLTIPYLTLFFQCLLSVFNLYIGYRILRFIRPEIKPTGLYLAAVLFAPSQFIYAVHYMNEIPFQTCLLLGLYYLLRFEQHDGKISELYKHHLCLIGCYLIKPVAMFLWIFSILHVILTKKDTKATVELSLLSTLHLLIIGGTMWYNYYRVGIAEYSSIGHKLFINYNLPALLNNLYGPEKAAYIVDSLQTEMSTESYPIQAAIADQFIRDEISNHPLNYFTVHVKGMLFFITDIGRWDVELMRKGRDYVEQLPSLTKKYKSGGASAVLDYFREWNPLYLLYFALSIISLAFVLVLFIQQLFFNRTNRSFIYLVAGIALYFAFLTGPSGSARFRVPVYPLIVAIAAGAIADYRRKIANSEQEPQSTLPATELPNG
jgi:hypothetical protein